MPPKNRISRISTAKNASSFFTFLPDQKKKGQCEPDKSGVESTLPLKDIVPIDLASDLSGKHVYSDANMIRIGKQENQGENEKG